jgi:ubiquinone/menaquinone biosynthesis C-methylase UbiE
MSSFKTNINQIWEIPIFYKLLQATLAGGGHAVIKKYLKKVVPKKAKKILDQGCGTGEYSLLFGDRYVGIDNNRDYIEQARKKYPGQFIIGTATDMKDLKRNYFDSVFAVGLHHHLTDEQARQAILESIRVCKKGGKVIIIDAMLPKNSFNIPGLVLRKMDRGGFVRPVAKTLELLPDKIKYQPGVLSSYPFDYITIEITK